jgi:heptosyltransferase-2
MSKTPHKILIRGVNWIGDAILTTPAVRAVHEAFPDAHISLLAKPRVAEIFREDPAVDETIIYEDRFNSILGRFKLAMVLKRKGFDTALLLQNAFDAALIAWLSRIPERIGYSRDIRSMLLTKAVSVDRNILGQHQVFYYINLLKESLGIQPENPEPILYLTDEETAHARNLLLDKLNSQDSHLIVGINPGATYGSAKRWLPERFAELIALIINELKGKVVLFGSKSEIELAQEIIERVNLNLVSRTPTKDTSHITHHASRILNMAGKTNLRELASLIAECDVFITNDSGPMHMASALQVPVVAIFGSTDIKTTAPFGQGHKIIKKDINCSPCLERECPEGHLRCMTEVSTEDVFRGLQEVLPRQRAVFLDRDGTLNEDVGYLNNFNDLKIFPGTFENLQRLKKAGFKLIGITNQSGIARGLTTKEFVLACNNFLQENLGIEAFYSCPHHPDDNCQCRKPKPLLVRKARLEHNIDLRSSYVIGDKTIDILLAKAVGAQGILVQTGHDRESGDADFVANNLTEAVDWILEREKTF